MPDHQVKSVTIRPTSHPPLGPPPYGCRHIKENYHDGSSLGVVYVTCGLPEEVIQAIAKEVAEYYGVPIIDQLKGDYATEPT